MRKILRLITHISIEDDEYRERYLIGDLQLKRRDLEETVFSLGFCGRITGQCRQPHSVTQCPFPQVKCGWWGRGLFFFTALTWLFWNILSLHFFGCVGQKFRNLSLWHSTSLLASSCSFHHDFRSRVFHNTLSASLQGHMKADFKENNVGSSWWKVRHFLSLEHFVYFSAYFIYFVQIPLSGGNMYVILQLHFFAHLKFYGAVC